MEYMLICKFCKNIFKRKSNLSRHERICKDNPDKLDETVYCLECGLKFSNKGNLLQHINMSHQDNYEDLKRRCAKAYMVNKEITTIYDISSRTRSKITERMHLPCSRCGWNESSCDFHHIISKKNGGDNSHNNISYLCPNCHRLAHTNKVYEFVSLEEQIGDLWKEFYYSE